MDGGKILRIQLEYSPNSSAAISAGAALLIWLLITGYPIASSSLVLNVAKIIEFISPKKTELAEKKKLVLKVLLKEGYGYQAKSLRRAKVTSIYLRTGEDLTKVINLIKSGKAEIISTQPAELE